MKRDIGKETHSTEPGNSSAKSSKQCLYYHDVPPELYRRAALRYTEGHKKYGTGPVNINWRIGITDPKYVADRLNHMFEHMLNFLENGDGLDDNLGAIVWNAGFLMEVQRLSPDTLDQVIGQSKLFGEEAEAYKALLEKKLKGMADENH